MPSPFALVDCNNFFVSCERVFNPQLERRPVVVLSNNDGCIIARSNEAKALDIPMGAPIHQYRRILQLHDAAIISSNHTLYLDMSRRVMATLGTLASEIEIYSIDEAFLRLNTPSDSAHETAAAIRQKIFQWTGIPTAIGIAPTKTLAKVASHAAKNRANDGIFDLREAAAQERVMRHLPIEELWGVSRRWGSKLRALGITTALQLRDADTTLIRSHCGIIGERIIHELRGLPCLSLQQTGSCKQNITTSRTFGIPLTEIAPIEEALATHAARACERLRKQNSIARGVCVFLQINPFQSQDLRYKSSRTVQLDFPTADTGLIIQASKTLLHTLYRKGHRYRKCGITLIDLLPDDFNQPHLFTKPEPQNHNLMKTVDQLNQTMGRDSVFYLAQGTEKIWQVRSNNRSPNYTTRWAELPRVF